MALGFLLNKAQLELAKAEVDTVVGIGAMVGDHYVVDSDYSVTFNRLAFTKAISRLTLNNGKIIRRSVMAHLNKLNHFQQRRAHLLPAGHPAMTHPRLARAMVNLSGARQEVLDPFCGAGGILIEAGLCGLHAVGFDTDDVMLKKAKENLDTFGIKGYYLEKQDATAFSSQPEAVVTDLPYGKSTKAPRNLDKLYLSFLKNVKKNSIRKIVIGFPDFVDYKTLITTSGLSIHNEFAYYLHRSLSKVIVILE